VLVIVEGPSDETALDLLFNRLFDRHEVHIEVVHGDITADYSIAPADIAKAVMKLAKEASLPIKFSRKDIQQVIHIVDTDGAYIPDGFVVEDKNAKDKPVYTETEIRTAHPERIILRNHHKQQKLDRLCQLKEIWGTVPYQIYYMSSNLDHALHGKLNSTDDEKEEDANNFAVKYMNDLPGFLEYLAKINGSKTSDYKQSWTYIKKERHSLERNSNLRLCF
jgi:hypothetical protein